MADISFKLGFCDQDEDISEIYVLPLGKLVKLNIRIHTNYEKNDIRFKCSIYLL